MRITFIILLFLVSFSCYAWSAMGHRIVAQIAYDHLTPAAKTKSEELVGYLADAYPYSSTFQTASSWADFLKFDDVHTYDNWHFYNKPYSLDGTSTTPLQTPNIVWALNHSIAILKSPNANQYEKAFFIRFLMHLTGDSHQPLHCINFFSAEYPHGDNGGNAEPTHLHKQWDDGLGLFDEHCGVSSSKSQRAKCFAKEIQTDYPETYFGQKAFDLNPQDWVDESYDIAKSHITSQDIIKQRLALAGYRLANTLNLLVGHP